MFKERNLYIALVICFVLYVVSDYYAPKPVDWTVTFGEYDKRPFGSYILYEQLDKFFPQKEASYKTLYELQSADYNQLILTTSFAFTETDSLALIQKVRSGATVLVGSESFRGRFFEAEGINTEFYMSLDYQYSRDSLPVRAGGNTYYYPKGIMQSYFVLEDDTDWKILARAERPILIEKSIGEGKLMLLSTPLIFSNYGLLQNDNYRLAAWLLRKLPIAPIVYNRFYLAGKNEAQTPFRFLLSQPALKAALYLSLFLLLTLIVVNSQYQRRPVPIYERPKNTTLHFIRTVGGLYYQEGDHRKAATKLINNFIYQLKANYSLQSIQDPQLAQKLSIWYRIKLDTATDTIQTLRQVLEKEQITEGELVSLYKKLEIFKRK